jgi:hypothetical protein
MLDVGQIHEVGFNSSGKPLYTAGFQLTHRATEVETSVKMASHEVIYSEIEKIIEVVFSHTLAFVSRDEIASALLNNDITRSLIETSLGPAAFSEEQAWEKAGKFVDWLNADITGGALRSARWNDGHYIRVKQKSKHPFSVFRIGIGNAENRPVGRILPIRIDWRPNGQEGALLQDFEAAHTARTDGRARRSPPPSKCRTTSSSIRVRPTSSAKSSSFGATACGAVESDGRIAAGSRNPTE